MTTLMERSAPPFLDDLPPSSGLAVRRWTPDEFRFAEILLAGKEYE